MLGSPYISQCKYDGAGKALATLYGSSLKASGAWKLNNLKTISQSAYFPNQQPVVGLGDTAYLYVPNACAQGASCSIHVSFHGCNQQLDKISTEYVHHAGYLEYAESNSIIVLFPQATEASSVNNPDACFDWWGYGSANYSVKSGPQMATINAMIAALKTRAGPVFV